MKKMSPIPTFAIALEIKAGRIPVSWTVRESHIVGWQGVDGTVLNEPRTERVFWPEVAKEAEVGDLENPLDVRASLFRLLNTNLGEGAALSFLNRVGAWALLRQGHVSQTENAPTNVAYRHRYAVGVRVLPVTLEDMQQTAMYWYGLLGLSKSEVKKRYSVPPSPDSTPAEQFSFALEANFANTLPMSLEWSGKHPRAVIEPICVTEILAAAAWADVVAGVPPQVCKECQTRFSSPRKRTHCLYECGHNAATRNYKRRLAEAKRSTTGGTNSGSK